MLFRALTVFLVCMTWLPAAAQDTAGALASLDHPLPVQTDVNLITATRRMIQRTIDILKA